MTRNVKLSEEVYEALQIIKVYPSTSFNDAIKGLIETQFPGIFFHSFPPVEDSPDDEERILYRHVIEAEKVRLRKK